MSRYLRGTVDEDLDFTSLAAKSLVSVVFDDTVNAYTRISSLVATYSLSSFTPGGNDGPLVVGVALSDYTDAEIEAFIELDDSWQKGALIEQEIAKRFIRRIGYLVQPVDSSHWGVMNDGRPIKTKLNWTLDSGQTLRLWVYNQGSSAVATTSPFVHAAGHVNLWRL